VRFTIGGLMVAVLVVALALVAWRSDSYVWRGAVFLTIYAVLALAAVGAACRKGAERAGWLGFAFFGWGYLGLSFRGVPDALAPVTAALWPLLRVSWYFKNEPGFGGQDVHAVDGLAALAAALFGGLLARALFGENVVRQGSDIPLTRPGQRPPLRWRRAAIIGLAYAGGATGVALAGFRWTPGALAAAVLMATWGAFGLAAVGAAYGRGRRRAACLGAVLFGAGSMLLVFERDLSTAGWPTFEIDDALNALRPRLPTFVGDPPDLPNTIAEDRRIATALDRVVPLHFPEETPLEDFLKTVREVTRTTDGFTVPIYVDQMALLEAEKTMTSPVRIDLDGVPLRTSLRLAVKPLGLDYTVRGGLLVIKGEGEPPTLSRAAPDPFLVVGHCLLGALTAALGGVLAARVAAPGTDGP